MYDRSNPERRSMSPWDMPLASRNSRSRFPISILQIETYCCLRVVMKTDDTLLNQTRSRVSTVALCAKADPISVRTRMGLRNIRSLLALGRSLPLNRGNSYARAASYMATIFCGGTSARMLWTCWKTNPPPGLRAATCAFTCSRTSSGVP
jgi:hypothetical protein